MAHISLFATQVRQLGQTATQSTVDGIAKIREGLSDLENKTLLALVQQDVEMGGRGAVPVPSTAPAPQIASGAAAVGVPLADAQQPDEVADAAADGSDLACMGCGAQQIDGCLAVCDWLDCTKAICKVGCTRKEIPESAVKENGQGRKFLLCPDHACHASTVPNTLVFRPDPQPKLGDTVATRRERLKARQAHLHGPQLSRASFSSRSRPAPR